MGDPKKPKKKYKTPNHPWEKQRIEIENKLVQQYGLKNKREIMKMESILRNIKQRIIKNIAITTKQAEKEKEQLLLHVQKMGLIDKAATPDDVLGLTMESILKRRLQTIIYTKGLARTIKQARQLITHKHICVGDKNVAVPSYLVLKEEEDKINYIANSTLNDPAHPERQVKKDETRK